MPIISEISELKSYIGAAGNVSIRMEDLSPFLDLVGHQHLRPWLGKTTYEELRDNHTDSPIASLLPYAQRPLALLGMYEYSKVNGIMITGSGNIRVEGENKKTAYKYQENAYRQVMLEQGWESIERMLEYLDDNEDDYLAWKVEAAKRHRSLFINYASTYRDLYGKQVSRYVFETLRPIIEELEEFLFVPMLGQPFFDAIKQNILDNDLEEEINVRRKELVQLMQRVLVHFAMKEGINRNWVRFDGDRVVQYESLEPQGNQKAGVAKNEPVAHQLRHNIDFANRHINAVKKHLETYQLDPTFEEYIAWQEEIKVIKTLSKILLRDIEAHEDIEALKAEYLDPDTLNALPKYQHRRPCGCWEVCKCADTKSDSGTFYL